MAWKVIDFLKKFLKKCKKDNISAFAAQSAFFLLLSLIPFLMVFSSLLKYTVVSEAVLLEVVYKLMPEYLSPFILSIVHEVYNKSVGIVSVTAVVAIWSASRGVQYTSEGLNCIHGIKETRNWLVRRFWAAVYTVVFLVAVVAVMVVLFFGNVLQNLWGRQMSFLGNVLDLLYPFRSIIMIAIMSGVFTILYKTLPNHKELQNKKLTLKNQFPGAVLCASAWYLLSFGISVYVDYFNGFSMYGSLTAIILFMLWLYFGMYLMLICAEVNIFLIAI